MLPHVRRPMSSDKSSDIQHLLRLQRQQARPGGESNASTTSRAEAHKFQTVVVATADFQLCCPHCSTSFTDEISLRSHVFSCRMDHGVDPLLPLNVLYRRGQVSQRRVQSAESRFASNQTRMQGAPSDDVASVMRSIECGMDISHKQLISPRLSSRVVPAPPTRPLPQQPHRRQANYGSSVLTEPISASTSLSLWQAPLRSLLARSSRPSSAFTVSQPLVTALSALASLSDVARDLTLNLTPVSLILQSDVALLARVLAPNRRAEAIPVTIVDISECSFEHVSSEELFLDSLKRHPTLQVLHTQGAHWRNTVPALDAVLQQCARNRARARLLESEQELQSQAIAFKRWQENQSQARQNVELTAQQESSAIGCDESNERKNINELASRALQYQTQFERKRRIREKKEIQRCEVVVNEERARGRMAAGFLSLLLYICEQLESSARKESAEERELCRLRLRVEDREDVFRAKVREVQRLEREAVERLQLESQLEVHLVLVMAESTEELDQIGKQKARHKAYTQWRRRQKEELDHLIRQEKLARDSVKNEEDSYFVSGREKLTRTIEGIQVRYANQREHVDTSEHNVRSILEKSMMSWMQLSLHFFESECRLITAWHNARSKESARVEALCALPSLELVEGGPQSLILFAAATPGHAAPQPVPLFPQTVKLQLCMGAEWQQRFQDLTQRCKRAAQDEASAFSDHMQALHRFCRLYRDSYAIAFETPLDELRTTYMQPLTRMQQIMSGTSSTSAQRASVSPPFGSWTPNTEDLNVSMRREKSKRKLSVAALPIEPVTDPVFIELADQSLRWRAAWHDRYSLHHIKNEKETIRHAFVEFAIEENIASPTSQSKASRSDDELLGRHRLLTHTSRSFFADEVLVAPRDQPAPHGVDLDAGSPTASHQGDTSNDFEGAPQPEAGVTSVPALTGASSTLRVDIRQPCDDIDLDSSLSSGVPTPTSAAKGRGSPKSSLSTDDITSELQNVLYQCVVNGSDMQNRGGCGLVRITFTVAVTVTVSNVYCDTALAPDVFGYVPRVPSYDTRDVVVETRGSFYVGVVPSCFIVAPQGQPLPIEQPPRILVEKQMDEVVVFPTLHRINGPLQVHRSKMSALLATAEEASQGFAGGTMIIEVVDGSASDRLSLRDDLPTLKFDCHDKTRAIRTITLNGSTFAEVVDGCVQSSRHVLGTNNLQVCPRVVLSLRDISSPATRISPESVKVILTRLRYHNFDVNPQEGPRVVRVTLRGANGAQSVLDTHFEVEGLDKPTELRIAFQKITHRAPYLSCPQALRGSLINTFLPVFPQCVVYDEDTDYFSGGGLRLSLQNAAKGDTLVFVPDARVLCPVDEMVDTIPTLRIVDQNQVVFQDRIVATLVEGNAALDQEFLDASTASESLLLRFEFAGDDQCSILAVQAILRHCAFVSLNPGMKLPHNASQLREVVCELQIQDNEQPTHITETVSIRAAGHSLQLPDKAALIDFKEGSPPIKIGNIDVSNDRVKPITAFSGAQILVYVGDGFTEGDTIGLKQDDTEYRVLEQKRAGSKPKGRVSLKDKVKLVTSEKFASSTSPTEPSTVSLSLPTPPQAALIPPLTGRMTSMEEVVQAASSQRVRVKQDILFAGMSTPMASLQSTKCGGLLITFLKDTKKDTITRKHVTTILRNLTFFSPPNPSIGFKVIRCLFADEPAASFTQVLVGVRLESVDDVTEIRMKSPRKACLQQAEANFALCPFGRSILVDEDTEFLDGGSFTIQCIAGSSRGDFFNIVPPSQQPQLPLQRQGQHIDGYTASAFPELTYNSDERVFTLGTTEVGRVETTARDGGVAEIKISFCRDVSSKAKIVPLHLASCMMNSILFGNSVEKLRDISRQFQLRIKDAENPIEGKSKLQLDLLPPHMVFASAPGTAPAVGAAVSPNSNSLSVSTTDSSFRARTTVGTQVSNSCSPGARVVVQCDTLHENKSGIAGGSVTITGRQQDRVKLVIPQSYYDEHGLTLQSETGDVCIADTKHFLFRLTKAGDAMITFDFKPSIAGMKSKPMTKSIVQAFFRALQVTVVSPLEASGRRSISVVPDVVMNASAFNTSAFSTSGSMHQEPTSSPARSPPTHDIAVPEMRIDEPIDDKKRASLGGGTSPQLRAMMAMRSPRGSISPVTNKLIIPRPRSSLSNAPDDDEPDDTMLTVKWTLHDGKHLSQLTTSVIPKR